jgi:membrane associated rhomboid family serine protease
VFPLRDNIPTRRFPILTVGLIVANVIMFFAFQDTYGLFGGTPDDYNQRIVEYGAIPYEISNPGTGCEAAGEGVVCEGQEGVSGDAEPQAPTWLTILTSMFMHGGLLHIAGNMLFLWIFGNNIEDSMGRGRFILFYLLGGAVALLAQTLAGPNAAVPTIGASGAVAAVLGGYALLYPRARVVTFVIIIFFITLIELPAFLVLGLWFLLQLLNGTADQVGQGGVAYFAHIGGFVFGLVLIKLFANKVHTDYDAAGRLPVY